MKLLFQIYAVLGALLIGLFAGINSRARDYSDGYNLGYRVGWDAANAPRPEKQVVTNLLCHYAELSCPNQSPRK